MFSSIHLNDPANGHMLVSKINPSMSQKKPLHGNTANDSLKQLVYLMTFIIWIPLIILELKHAYRPDL